MTATPNPIDLGSEVPSEFSDEPLVIEIAPRYSFGKDANNDNLLGAALSRPTTTASGRRGKTRKILTLVSNDGAPALLRQIADLIEAGPVAWGGDS